MENVSSRCGKSDNAPRLRFPEFRGEWEEKRFSELFSFISNNTLSRAELSDAGEIKNIHYGDILVKYGAILSATDIGIPFVVNSKKIKKSDFLKDGDIIISDTAEDETVGKAIEIIDSKNIKLVAGLHTIACRPKLSFGLAYLGYYINSPSFHYQLIPLMQGIKVTSISKSNILTTFIRFPSLPEQKKIAAFFTLLDRRIQKQRQLVECLKTYKRGVIDKFFCNNSYDFELYRLEEIGKFIRGLSYKEDEQTYDNQKTLVLRSNNIRDNGFLNYKEGLQFVTKIPDCEQLLQKNDLVFCMANGSSKLVGKNAVYDGRYNGKITVGTFCCIYRSKFHILQYYFQSSLFQKTLGKIQQGGGGSIGNLKPSDLEPLIVKLPNKYTQEKIFNCLSFFDSYIKLHENKLSSLLSLKSSLLQKMFI